MNQTIIFKRLNVKRNKSTAIEITLYINNINIKKNESLMLIKIFLY